MKILAVLPKNVTKLQNNEMSLSKEGEEGAMAPWSEHSSLDRAVHVRPWPWTLSPGQTIATCRHNISQHCWAQHVACVWPPCCDVLGVVGSSLKMVKFEPTTPNTSQQGGQTHTTCCAQQCCDMLR